MSIDSYQYLYCYNIYLITLPMEDSTIQLATAAYSQLANLWKFRFVLKGTDQANLLLINGTVGNRFFSYSQQDFVKNFSKLPYIQFKISQKDYYKVEQNDRFKYTQYFYQNNVELTRIKSEADALYLLRLSSDPQDANSQLDNILIDYPYEYIVSSEQAPKLKHGYYGSIPFQQFYGLTGDLHLRIYENGKRMYSIDLTGFKEKTFNIQLNTQAK